MYYRFPVMKRHIVTCGFRAYSKPRWKWLEKLMRRCFLLVDEYDPITKDAYETFDICDTNVQEVLRKGMMMTCREAHIKPTRVYIGREYFQDLCQSLENNLHHEIKMPFRVWGVEVVVTPYLEGFLPVWEGTSI